MITKNIFYYTLIMLCSISHAIITFAAVTAVPQPKTMHYVKTLRYTVHGTIALFELHNDLKTSVIVKRSHDTTDLLQPGSYLEIKTGTCSGYYNKLAKLVGKGTAFSFFALSIDGAHYIILLENKNISAVGGSLYVKRTMSDLLKDSIPYQARQKKTSSEQA